MTTISIEEAQAKLPDLIHRLHSGDEVVITENDQPVARLVPTAVEPRQQPAGVEEAWAAEIEHRMAEYRAGRVKTIPWSEVRARLHRTDR